MKLHGEHDDDVSYHSSFTRRAYSVTRFPLVPRTLSLFIWESSNYVRKYWVKGHVLDIHYSPEFIKHVLPRF